MIEEDDEITGGDIFIQPPSEGLVSDEDSGDDSEVTINNLTRNQLHAAADAKVHKVDGTRQQLTSMETGDVEEESSRNDDTEDGDTSGETGRSSMNYSFLLQFRC